jgi:tetratricopeptide (TPR) repeat protein
MTMPTKLLHLFQNLAKEYKWHQLLEVTNDLQRSYQSAQIQYYRAQSLHKLKQKEEAIAVLQQAVSDFSSDTKCLFALIKIFVEDGNYAAAFNTLESTVQQTNNPSLILVKYHQLSKQLNLVGKNVELLEQMIETQTESPEVYLELILQYIALGAVEDARSVWHKSPNFKPDQELKILRAFTAIGENLLSTLEIKILLFDKLNLSNDERYQTLLQVGEIELLESLLQEEDDEISQRWKAKCASWRGEYRKAQKTIKNDNSPEANIIRFGIQVQCSSSKNLPLIESQRLEPKLFQENALLKGEFYRKKQRYRQAEEFLRKAQENNDSSNIRAKINAILTKIDNALQSNKEEPFDIWDSADILVYIAKRHPLEINRSKMLLDKEEMMQLRVNIQSFLDKWNGNFTIHPTWMNDGKLQALPNFSTMRSRCAKITPRIIDFSHKKVMQAFTRLEKRYLPHPLICTYRAEINLWHGFFQQAKQDLEKALKYTHKTRWAYNGLSLSYALLGYPQKGLEVIQRAKEIFPPLEASLVYEAEMLYRCNELEKAIVVVEAAIKAHPNRISARIIKLLIGKGKEQDRQTIQRLCPQFYFHFKQETENRNGLAIWEHALSMLQGNRSSQMITWKTSDGLMWWSKLRT